eukprot:8995819-Lingulodinium_polyedra.AAC.1
MFFTRAPLGDALRAANGRRPTGENAARPADLGLPGPCLGNVQGDVHHFLLHGLESPAHLEPALGN